MALNTSWRVPREPCEDSLLLAMTGSARSCAKDTMPLPVRRIHVPATSIDLRESDRVPRPRCARRSRGWWTSRGIRALGRDDPDHHLRHVQDAAGPGGLVLCDPRPRTPGHDGDRACHVGGCHPRVNGTTK